MNSCRAAVGIVLYLALLAALPAIAHDHTRRSFEKSRVLAQAAARDQSEVAPQVPSKDTCRLTVELTLDDTAQLVPGLLRVTNLGTGKALLFKDEIQRDENWHAVEGRVELLVPRARLQLEAVRGLTTELVRLPLDLSGQETASVRVSLHTFYDPHARGWRAGNTHLHLTRLTHAEAERYLRLVPQADGLDLVFLSFLRRVPDERDYISNTFTAGDLGRLSRHGVLFGNGQEHRHNFGRGGQGYGHVMFLNILKLIEPVSIGPGIMLEGTDGIPLARGIRTARDDGATVIWCHNRFGYEDIPNWVSGLVDAQNIHDGGRHGSYEDTFYRYLNVGMRVPFSTGTDWFIYDFSRVYVPVEGQLTVGNWLSALAAGKSFITNGVFLEFQAGGKEIGDTIDAAEGDQLPITGRAISRNDFCRLELIHNGRVVHTVQSEPLNNHFAAELDFLLPVSQPGWIALNIPEEMGKNEFGRPLFAHTSPIYIEMAGKHIFEPEVAGQFAQEMEESMQVISTQGKFASAREKEAVLRVYREAIATVQSWIDQQSPSAPRK